MLSVFIRSTNLFKDFQNSKYVFYIYLANFSVYFLTSVPCPCVLLCRFVLRWFAGRRNRTRYDRMGVLKSHVQWTGRILVGRDPCNSFRSWHFDGKLVSKGRNIPNPTDQRSVSLASIYFILQEDVISKGLMTHV